MESKKKFETPEIEVIHFDVKDVITSSGEGNKPSSTSFKTNGFYNYRDLGI